MDSHAPQTLDLETEDITSRSWDELVSEFLDDEEPDTRIRPTGYDCNSSVDNPSR
jgi:hypothetical protein